MSKLGVWLDNKEYGFDVNEETTCDEIIEQLIQPVDHTKQHLLTNINACEYKLDVGLCTKQTSQGNIYSDSRMFTKYRSSLSLSYEMRLKDLSEWIALVDAAIEVYDNSDDDDGLNEEEIIENQVTRLGLLLKKQSLKLGNITQTQELIKEQRLQEQLLHELHQEFDNINYLENKLKETNSKFVSLALKQGNRQGNSFFYNNESQRREALQSMLCSNVNSKVCMSKHDTALYKTKDHTIKTGSSSGIQKCSDISSYNNDTSASPRVPGTKNTRQFEYMGYTKEKGSSIEDWLNKPQKDHKHTASILV